MVFQNYALYPHMTVYDNMAFGLKLRKLPKAEIDQRVREAAKILGIEKYLDRKPKQLSGGQRQRVAVGRAIVRNPKVFLFDEPLSNLDAKLRVQMRAEISDLHNRLQTTMIYVTHDQVEAMTMGDKIVVMKDGLIQQIGSPLYLYNHPVNKFVAGFIGSPPMNFLNVKVLEEGGRIVLDEGPSPSPTESQVALLKPYVGKDRDSGPPARGSALCRVKRQPEDDDHRRRAARRRDSPLGQDHDQPARIKGTAPPHVQGRRSGGIRAGDGKGTLLRCRSPRSPSCPSRSSRNAERRTGFRCPGRKAGHPSGGPFLSLRL